MGKKKLKRKFKLGDTVRLPDGGARRWSPSKQRYVPVDPDARYTIVGESLAGRVILQQKSGDAYTTVNYDKIVKAKPLKRFIASRTVRQNVGVMAEDEDHALRVAGGLHKNRWNTDVGPIDISKPDTKLSDELTSSGC